MYSSIYELKRTITDYQLSLLLHLQNNSKIVTNEGNYFRAWLETDNKENKSVAVRKDVADKILANRLIQSTEGSINSYFYYTLSPKANELLSIIDKQRLQKIKTRHGETL